MKPIPASQIRASDAVRRLNPTVFGGGYPPQTDFSRALFRISQMSSADMVEASKHIVMSSCGVKKRKQTKTEAEAGRFLEATGLYSEVRFQKGLTYHLENGKRYRIDFVCLPKDTTQKLVMVEVKGSYRLHSQSRSEMAYAQASIEWPMFQFMWMTKTKEGWSVG